MEAFGFPTQPASIEAVARAASWRASRALLAAAVALGVAPIVALVPPHFPWLIGAVVTGGVLARRRLTERYTVLSMTAVCPRCGAPVTTGPGRLTAERTVSCGSCNQDSVLTVHV